MKILVAAYIAGQTDLYRFQEHLRPFYPESEIVTFEQSYYILKIRVASGKVYLGKSINFSIDYYLHRSSCAVYVIELDDKVEEAIKDPNTFLFKFFPFTINNQEIKNSFYFIMAELIIRALRLETHQEFVAVLNKSNIKQEVLANSGIDFLLVGKDGFYSDYGGVFSPLIIEEIPQNTDKLEKIELNEETIFVQDRTIFYTANESLHKKIIFYTLIANFYGWQVRFTTTYLYEMKKDIAGLKQGLIIKGNVGWEWEIQEFDIKRLNFLEYLPYYRMFDNIYSYSYIPTEIKSLFHLNDVKANINANLNSIQFSMTEIDRMVEEKQAALATRRSKNLEYLLTVLGGLGGVGAILAALFAGGLKLETRIIAVLLLLFIPLFIVVFEYLVRKGITKRSREAYVNTKITNLIKEKQGYERFLKLMQEQGKAFPESQAEFSQGAINLIKRIEKEIEELSKIK